MTIFKIDTPREFFAHIVSTDVAEFLTNDPALRRAYHACNSLLSYRDWVFATYKGMEWRCLGAVQAPFSSKGQFQKALELADQGFAIVADIANASKHMTLERGSNSGLKGNSDTQIEHIGGAFDAATFDPAAFDTGIQTIYVNIERQRHDVIVSVRNTYETWVKLNAENRW